MGEDVLVVDGFGRNDSGVVVDVELAKLRGEIRVNFELVRFKKSHDVPESPQALVFELLQRRTEWYEEQERERKAEAVAAAAERQNQLERERTKFGKRRGEGRDAVAQKAEAEKLAELLENVPMALALPPTFAAYSYNSYLKPDKATVPDGKPNVKPPAKKSKK